MRICKPNPLRRHLVQTRCLVSRLWIITRQVSKPQIIGIDDDFTLKLFDNAFCSGARKVIPISVKQSVPEGFYVFKDQLMRNHKGEDIRIDDLNGFETLRGVHNYQNMAY